MTFLEREESNFSQEKVLMKSKNDDFWKEKFKVTFLII
jgi:hypothetical protein